jgi:hypothetical protein
VIEPGAKAGVPTGYSERAVYVVEGEVEINGYPLQAGRMAVFGQEGQPVVTAKTRAVVMALGGEPLGQRYLWWNLVSSRPERIAQARADWIAGRFTLPPDDREEWIPAPDDPLPKAR